MEALLLISLVLSAVAIATAVISVFWHRLQLHSFVRDSSHVQKHLEEWTAVWRDRIENLMAEVRAEKKAADQARSRATSAQTRLKKSQEAAGIRDESAEELDDGAVLRPTGITRGETPRNPRELPKDERERYRDQKYAQWRAAQARGA